MRLEYYGPDSPKGKWWEIHRSGTTVTVEWGAIGTTGQEGEPKGFGDDAAAIAFVNKMVASKERKGYERVRAAVRRSTPTPAPRARGGRETALARTEQQARRTQRPHVVAQLATDNATRPSDLKPMKMQEGELDHFDRYAANSQWVAEQKFDGIRCMARIGSHRVDFVGFGGVHLANKKEIFAKLRRELNNVITAGVTLVLDGELLADGSYWVYDCPLLLTGDPDMESHPMVTFHVRRRLLESVLDAWGPGWSSIHLVPQARTYATKMSLLAKVRKAGGEGVVVKNVLSAYRPVVRTDEWFKLKFIKTCDAVVMARNTEGHTNAQVGMYARKTDVKPTRVGGCSMIGKPNAKVGDVIELTYLYATADLILYQPRMMRLRPDKPAKDCLLSQLTAGKSKTAVITNVA